MEDLIAKAIDQQRMLLFYYNGMVRKVEPYVYGYDKNGIKKLRAYQIEGASKSGKSEDWKLFCVDKILSIQILEQIKAFPRPGYNNAGDSAISIIISKI